MDTDIKVVSLDIFDTLLLRPFIKPSDLFKYIEVKEKADGFFYWRCRIEKQLQKKFKRQVAFDELYDNAPDKYKKLKQVELETEYNFLVANKKIKNIFDEYKSKGYRIITISDMYLSSKFLMSVLEKNGYTGIEKIYVSNEYNATKFSGKLYNTVLSELNINPYELYHIGDNALSDYLVPKRLGIKTEHIERPKTSVFKKEKFIKKYYSKHKTLAHSIISSSIINNQTEMNKLERFGFEVAAPMVFSYSSFVYKKIKEQNIDKLLCIARDGYFVKICFDMLSLDIATEYTYAPRYQYYLTHYDTDFQTDNSIPRFILSYFNIDTKENKRTWIKKHKQELEPLLENERNKLGYASYINNVVGSSKNIAIVDGPSGKRTSQKFIQKELNKDVLTFYIQVLPRRIYKHFIIDSLLKFPKHYIINRVHRSAFIERVFTSPYNGVELVDKNGTVIYKKSDEHTSSREQFYKEVEKGVRKFFEIIAPYKDIIDIFSDDTVFEDMLYCYTKYNKKSVKEVKKSLTQDTWWLYKESC